MSDQNTIYEEMNSQAEKSEHLLEVSTTSKVGVFRTLLYVISFSISNLKELFEIHKKEITDNINNKQRHDLYWYKSLALNFQYGHNLVMDTDYYNNSALTDEEIETAKIIKYAVAVEEKDKSTTYIKVANANREPIDNDELTAFEDYIHEVSDVGVHVCVINEPADNLKLEIDVYYDAQVLAANGSLHTDSSVFPVMDAVQTFIEGLDFNYPYNSVQVIEAVQKVSGVIITEIKGSYYKYGVLDFQPINGQCVSKSGNIDVLEEDLLINYITL